MRSNIAVQLREVDNGCLTRSGRVMMKILDMDVVWIAGDLNDHVGEGSLDAEVTGKSTTDAIFALRQVVKKYREGQEELHLEKAYDQVPRQEVWNCLRLKEVEKKCIRLVQDVYESSMTLVRCATGDTEEFEVTMHQGSALSPFLFAVIIDCLTGEMQKEATWDIIFADDVVVCAETKVEVEQRLELWREVMEVRGVKADGGSEREVTKRIRAGWGAWQKITGVMCDRKVSDTVKGRMYRTMVRPAMMHGMEAVAVA
ncbi:uncharacterized protein LOC125042450 [Penaeus chinensis]|uniref:uncharacterized protein LOC125042450 n=1 Tax=Penaeus chinensis TaxID=139456 RepID=UPI001FB6FAC5|nr:uncharacterized protein LOC125042450 [Penaeus chinensis]